MRKVIGVGETIMDIIFQGQQPSAAVPGGSSFNSIISIGRAGLPAVFVGETGQDLVGKRIADFMQENHVKSDFLNMRTDVKSALSLAFLNANNDAEYLFYKKEPQCSADAPHPIVSKGDVIQFGSFYAISQGTREFMRKFLSYANKEDGILYYDLNFRRSHRAELEQLLPIIHENFRLTDVVRGSADDFEIMFDLRDAEAIYRQHIAPYCPIFICTKGGEEITVCTPHQTLRFNVPPVKTVSTIGAGDNFNAGFIYGLFRYGIYKQDLLNLSDEMWGKLVECGRKFAANVCASIHNSIDKDFGEQMKREMM